MPYQDPVKIPVDVVPTLIPEIVVQAPEDQLAQAIQLLSQILSKMDDMQIFLMEQFR